tara:strand:- start:530 stop:649 length:120 start_codon:yes stop_codon:yes gene_type:complete
MLECGKCYAEVEETELDFDHNICKSCIADWIEEIEAQGL